MTRQLPFVRSCAFVAFSFLAAAFAGSAPAGAESQTTPASLTALNVCGSSIVAFTEDDVSGFPAPCVAAPGSLIIETVYFQNASRVGGTALAAYPLVRLRTGIASRLEVVLDTPSQIAESGLHGLGLYPTTHLGYGLNYNVLATSRMALGIGSELVPQSSRFTVNAHQPRYVADFNLGYRVGDRTTISALADGASSQSVGFNRIAPAATLRVAYDSGPSTQLSTDFGSRLVARNANLQKYADVALNERVRKNITYSVGLGTTFNPVGNEKTHYLASGFDFHLR